MSLGTRNYSIVGTNIPRLDAIDKVTGQAKFTGDLNLPGMLEVKVLRSALPHAALESIDTTECERFPGVVAVLTRNELCDIDPFYGNCLRDRPVVALDRVRFAGEPVAAVAAESGLAAEEAASLIQVNYRELPCLATVEEALSPEAPLLHEGAPGVGEFHDIAGLGTQQRPNVCHHEQYEKGQAARGFAIADDIVEETFEFPMIYHFAMEPHSAVACFTSEGITLWTSSAHPFLVRSELAHMFHLPQRRVDVIVPFVGGAYGSKSYFKIEPLIVAMARKTAGRPVRLVQSAAESMLTTRRHSARCRIKTGVTHSGALVAREAEVLLDTGAYADNGPRVAKRTVSRLIGPYKLQHCRIDVLCVYTNTVPAGSMRSIGGPQTVWAVESHMDTIAHRLRLDPLEFRLRNLLGRGEELRARATPVDADLRQGTKRVASAIGWAKQRKIKGRGVGIAIGVSDSEAMPVSTALVRLLSDGSVIVLAGSTEVGQGARTVLSQIAAQHLDVPVANVIMPGTPTLTTPFDRSTGASRSPTVMGRAVKAAAIDLRKQLVDAAAELFGAAAANIMLANGEVVCGEKRLSYGSVVARFFGMSGGELLGRGYMRPGAGMGATLPLFWETGMG